MMERKRGTISFKIMVALMALRTAICVADGSVACEWRARTRIDVFFLK